MDGGDSQFLTRNQRQAAAHGLLINSALVAEVPLTGLSLLHEIGPHSRWDIPHDSDASETKTDHDACCDFTSFRFA